MCATYRPPSADETSVADYFDRTLPTMRAKADTVILQGDFNWHFSRTTQDTFQAPI